MADSTRPDAARRRRLIQGVIAAVIVLLIILLYPQLQDFGAEIVRAVRGD